MTDTEKLAAISALCDERKFVFVDELLAILNEE